ncbi:MAG: ATP-binding cassette domain-containing protein [Candidatus Marsarchaeota archaeon]|nr:ATP-binding cassette domain-containing protein [Candidatus Marsarchaeota archaeon]
MNKDDDNIIEIKNLIKTFGSFIAVDNVSLNIERGKIFGLLGPNGAGKTTTISLVLGILKPTSGAIVIDGLDNIKDNELVKEKIGFMTQETIVDSDLTAYENLKIAGKLYHLKGEALEAAIKNALKEADLEAFANKKAGSFSGGMKRRLYLVKSMIHAPKILILDEPTTGLDVQNRVEMWKRIDDLNKRGVTVILTTQYLEEADRLCNKIAIIDHGKIVAHGTASELKKQVSEGSVIEIIAETNVVEQIVKLLRTKLKLEVNVEDEKIEAFVAKDDIKMVSKVADAIYKEKITISSISLRLPTMDDVFIKLTGSSIRDKLEEQNSDRANIMIKR